MAPRDESIEPQDEHDDIPELEDVVAPAPPPEPAPPPNLDLFGAGEVDLDAFRESLTLRLDAEIDKIINELVVELETALRERAEKHLRERLPDIVATVLAEQTADGQDH